MTSEEQFNQDIWKVLQEIRKEQLLAPKGTKLRLVVGQSQFAEGRRKLLLKLNEWGVFTKLEPENDFADLLDAFGFSGPPSTQPSSYILTINPSVFDELYRVYEKGGDYKEYQSKIKQEKEQGEMIMRPKTLELVSCDIGELDSGPNLVNFLIGCGVDESLVEYPNTKWRMVYSVLSHLAASGSVDEYQKLFKVLSEAVHPLMHEGSEESANAFRDKFNSYLKYDGYQIIFKEDSTDFQVISTKGQDGNLLNHKSHIDSEQYKEKISLLRKTYQTLMGVVEVFCQNPSKPDTTLNNYYVSLSEGVWGVIDELRLSGVFGKYKKPFSNLFSAEKERAGKVGWDEIRPDMSAMFGDIEALYQKQNGSDILAEPDKQKELNDIMLYLSELKEKTKPVKKEEYIDKKVTDLRIVEMPEIKVAGLAEKFTQSGEIIKQPPSKDGKLYFYEDGKIEYCGEIGEVVSGKKDYVLLQFLNSNKNTHFNVDDVRKHCNSLVNKEAHKFKGEKDIDDTIRQIKHKLKVLKGAYFPINKRSKGNTKEWLWVEKT